VLQQLAGSSAFRAKVALADRALRIAFDLNDLPVCVIDQLPATHRAVRANGSGDLRVLDPRAHAPGLIGHDLNPSAAETIA